MHVHTTEPAQVPFPSLTPSPRERYLREVAAARVAFGWTLIVGAPALVWFVTERDVSAFLAIPAVWAAALLAGACGLLCGASIVDRVVPSSRAMSWAVALAGLAMMAPITLHMLVDAPAWAPRIYLSMAGDRTFAHWVASSAILTGPAHCVFALLCGWRAFRLANSGTAKPSRRTIVVATALVALAVDATVYRVYAFLPAIYVAVTAGLLLRFGLPFIERIIGRERIAMSSSSLDRCSIDLGQERTRLS